ncbi:MAG: bifunctional [glutamine synthetase] adenylyltransferase/[glutamine synthetase]-adenylyl-L-tyrosine phosphorylase, partial [Alphaproteobacteria bacterium]|nr:bifunctional [glutamine synthetase] adenylyltransferase/[glutamine synthetase]-adenylyl-L-tyrosine phosphorylase [Alphaproteobacteria bacterium]
MIVSAHGIQLPPKSFEPQRAARTFNGLAERGYVPSPADLPLLEALFGNSAYLARVALRNATFLKALFSRGVATCFDETCGEAAAAEHATTLKDVMAMLRAAKARAALSVGLADISGKWPLEAVTAALTRFADISTGAALRFLLNQAAAQARPEISSSSEDLERASGLVVLALGKFGGEELNYSSDIDLIVFYDPARFPFRKRGDARGAAVDIVKGLVRLLSEITADGYVFRVDLRLRPDAGATQIAISTDAAQAYYENMGQNWGRAALIKARPCAGDLDAARTLLRNLEPFVWRRTLDYAAIDDIHSIKRQIHAHAGHDKLAVAGHDIKVGRGGIREIEFFVQTQQLILGGRDRSLRPRSTLAALKALEARGLVDAQTASNLATAYIFLRTLEHRLQMIEDQQTHTIPSEEEGLKHIACFMGFGSVALFSDAVLAHLGTVQQHYGRLFERAPPLASSAGSLVFTGVENDRETLRTLHRLGFSDPDHVAQAVRGWHHGRVRATRGPRARELLTKLVPALLNALASSADPDGAFSQFDRFLSRLPTGVQLFSMLLANPHLLKLLADICGVAPRFAGALGRSPRLLDALLDADFLLAAPDYATLSRLLASDLEQASSYELKLDAVRRFAGEQVFRTAVHMMEGLASGEKGAQAFTSIAEAVISNTLPMVENEFRRSFGGIEGGAFAVIVLGRLGG